MKKNIIYCILAMMLILSLCFNIFGEEVQYKSELTNEMIDISLKDQRPIAIMVDNEVTALDHYGINQSDIVYEITNSTINGRITRLMCVMKDWMKLTQFGSIRSTRTTNVYLSGEYNAILCHDGTASAMVPDFSKDYYCGLWGGFARFSNGKNREFTEYVTLNDYKNPNTGEFSYGLLNKIAQNGFSTNYTNKWYEGQYFNFSDENYTLEAYQSAIPANVVKIPTPHNNSTLTFNSSTETYDYSEYGRNHIDALDGSVTTFKNVIIQSCDFVDVPGSQGYLAFNLFTTDIDTGYYLTNGKAIPIKWKKDSEYSKTNYYNAESGEELLLNTGKTYIAITPSDTFDQLIIQ